MVPLRGRPVRALLAALLLSVAGCASDSGEAPSPPPGEPPPPTVAATPGAPAWSGERAVVLAAGSRVLTPLRCTPNAEERLVCDAEGATYSWVGVPQPVTLVAARATLDRGHTAWRAVLRFAAGAQERLRRAVRPAGTADLLLVQDVDATVLVALPRPAAEGTVLVLRRLEKPEAWRIVRALGG